MRVAQIGNFTPPHSTENHLARALEYNEHIVDRWQENDPRTFENLGSVPLVDVDFVLWTRTGWDWSQVFGRSDGEGHAHTLQRRMLRFCADKNIPVASYHLDIWHGLAREHLLDTEPFFEAPLVVTADGGHDAEFARRGIAHRWLPPAVSLAETEPGMWRSDLASPLAFVGSHNGDYHPESAHRHELVRWLKTNFTRDCAFWPRPGEHALRGNDLRDLYQSVDVLVGDSCFAGSGLKNYWSDRIPETLGRGGYLLHPFVEGMVEQGFNSSTMATWTAFDWDALGTQIEYALANPEHRTLVSAQGREMVRERHTYEVRMNQLVELLYERKLLKRPRAEKAAPMFPKVIAEQLQKANKSAAPDQDAPK